MTTYSFRPGIREKVGLILGAAGPSGGGKTYTAMRLATGIVGPGKKFAVIDTEARRALHYASMFNFDHLELKPPFRPAVYADAIRDADKAGYGAIVVDSGSHAWNGEGGVLDWQEQELQRMAGDDYAKRERVKMASWIKPKMAHKAMVQRLLQTRAHLIFCLRAEEKVEIVKDAQGKNQIVPKGYQPICAKDFPFELTISFLLLPDRPGVPVPIKLQEQHRVLFPDGKPITEETGRLLAEWANGGAGPRQMTKDEEHVAGEALRTSSTTPPARIKRREAEAPMVVDYIPPVAFSAEALRGAERLEDIPWPTVQMTKEQIAQSLEPVDAPQNAPEPLPQSTLDAVQGKVILGLPAAEAPAVGAAAPAPTAYHNALDTKVMMRDADWTPGDSETEFWLPTQGGDLAYWFSEETEQCARKPDKTHLRTFWSYNGDALKRIKEGDPATYKALEKLKDQARVKIGGTK